MTTAMRPATVDELVARHGDVQVLPVSFAQQRFYVLDQLEGGAASYTIPIALRLRGPLDAAALERALNVVVERHESLRTLFAFENGEPVQVVLPALHVAIAVDDLAALDDRTRDDAVAARATANANAPFDLAAGPLLRAALLRLAADEHVLLLSLHHIVSDGWSVGVLYDELETAYAAVVAGGTPSLSALPLQYPDYAVWQREATQGAGAARQLAYWTDRLRDVPALELATDRARPAVQTANGGKRESILPAEVVESIRALGRREGATSYMAFLAAWVALLHRYTRQSDLVVGSITSGRGRPELERLIGLFVNTLAIRVEVAGGDVSYVELLRHVRERATEAYANQDVPFEQVVDSVQPTRDRSRSPIFQAAFQLLDVLARDLRLEGVRSSRIAGTKETTKFELTLVLNAAPDGALRAVLEYNSDLFDADTIDRMLEHYAVLLAAIARTPNTPIARLPLLSDAERERLLVQWAGATVSVPDRSLHELILEQAARTPDVIAVESDGADGRVTRLTYADLADRALSLARHLRALGVRPGVGVGVCAERSCDLVVALVGVLAAGGHYVPLDAGYPAERIAYMLEQSGVPVLLTQASLRARLPLAATAVHVVALDAQWDEIASSGASGEDVPARVGAEDLAYVIYTSGSTGRPKGVMIPHRAVVNYLHWMRTEYPVGQGDGILQKAPASFDACIWEFFLPLVTGARLVLARAGGHQDPAYLTDVVQRLQVTVLQLVPSQLQMMLETPAFGDCSMLRHVFCGGEALPGELLGRLASAMPHVRVTNLYGPTETTVYSTHWSLDRARFDGSAPIGRPIYNTRVHVLDPALPSAPWAEPLPIGVPGELCIAGRGVALGYLGQPELTAEKFVVDPFATGPAERMYRTGDLARWRADGTLEYLGRADHQVKLRGFRIELGEIESVLAADPRVQAVAAIVREDAPGDKRLVAYVVATGERPSVAALRALVQAQLPEFMVPSAVVFLDALPLSANGKLDRRALPAPDASADEGTPYVAPRSPLEAQIADVWSDVLGGARVGMHDDFFSLGGHSLLAMRVIARLADVLPIRLTIGAMFEARTVAGLASLVVQRLAEQDVASGGDDELARLLAELDEMTDEEAARMLDTAEPRS